MKLKDSKWSVEIRKYEKIRSGARERAIEQKLHEFLLPHIECQKKPVVDSVGNEFSSMVEAAKFHGLSKSTMTSHLNGKIKKTKTGISFKYKK